MSFLTPKVKTMPAPPPPVIEDTAGKEQEQADMLRRRRGRAASILSDRTGALPVTAAKQLLGQ